MQAVIIRFDSIHYQLYVEEENTDNKTTRIPA